MEKNGKENERKKPDVSVEIDQEVVRLAFSGVEFLSQDVKGKEAAEKEKCVNGKEGVTHDGDEWRF